jgi:predicted nucleotidyltransferase
MELELKELVDRLKSAYGQRLVSVILYGSAASGDHDAAFSDVNVLCVLDRVDAASLKQSEPVFRWWREQNPVPPLLMDESDVRHSTDCFPIEFQDMKDRRQVLHGKDLIEGMTIDFSFYRARIEYELRSKLLRLRYRATPLLGDKDSLIRLCADSLSTFLVLARHALRLSGNAVGIQRREIVAELNRVLGREFDAFDVLLDVREGKQPSAVADPLTLFDNYLNQIHAVTNYVDGLSK